MINTKTRGVCFGHVDSIIYNNRRASCMELSDLLAIPTFALLCLRQTRGLLIVARQQAENYITGFPKKACGCR